MKKYIVLIVATLLMTGCSIRTSGDSVAKKNSGLYRKINYYQINKIVSTNLDDNDLIIKTRTTVDMKNSSAVVTSNVDNDITSEVYKKFRDVSGVIVVREIDGVKYKFDTDYSGVGMTERDETLYKELDSILKSDLSKVEKEVDKREVLDNFNSIESSSNNKSNRSGYKVYVQPEYSERLLSSLELVADYESTLGVNRGDIINMSWYFYTDSKGYIEAIEPSFKDSDMNLIYYISRSKVKNKEGKFKYRDYKSYEYIEDIEGDELVIIE